MSLIDDIKPGESKTIPRRHFLKIITGIFSGFITLTLAIPLIESLFGSVIKTKNKIFSKLTAYNAIPEDKPVNLTFLITEDDAFIKNVQPENVWVVKKSDSEAKVFSPVCPHLGCRYTWHADQKLFICPCHNSVFNAEGQVVSGPAPRPLDTLPTKVKDDNLYVLWERFKPGIPKKEII